MKKSDDETMVYRAEKTTEGSRFKMTAIMQKLQEKILMVEHRPGNVVFQAIEQ